MPRTKKLNIKWICLITTLMFVISTWATGCNRKIESPTTSKEQIDKFPEKPIEVIVSSSAGGSTDVMARQLCKIAEEKLGQPLAIVNKGGGSGAVAYKELTEKKPDGYTLVAWFLSIVTHKLLGNLPYNHRDFEHIITHNYEPCALIVPANSPYKTLREFINSAKQKPGQVKMSVVSKGSTTHAAVLALEYDLGLKFNFVEQIGGANVLTMVSGGHVDCAVVASGEAVSGAKNGLVRVLGIIGDERVEAIKEVPTFKEEGYNISVVIKRGFMLPKGTPKDRIDKLYQAFKAAAEDPRYVNFVKDYGAIPKSLGPQETLKMLDEEEKFYREIYTKSGDIKTQ